MFCNKMIKDKEMLVFEDFVYDDELLEWVYIEDYINNVTTEEIINEENVNVGQSTII